MVPAQSSLTPPSRGFYGRSAMAKLVRPGYRAAGWLVGLAVMSTGLVYYVAGPAPSVVPVIRFIHQPGLSGPDEALRSGVPVALVGESRLVLSATRQLPVPLICPPSAGQTCKVDLPPALRAAPRLLANLLPTGRTYFLEPAILSGMAVPAGVTVEAGLVPELAARDVTTAPVEVPARATLAFAVGVEQAGWVTDSAPTAFTIEALADGRVTPLYRRVLDPARVSTDRRWIDEHVDLGALAGTTVRLQFATRPARADDRRASLPLWGEPAVLAPRPPARRNVVLVSLDTLRAASVSAYGCRRATTPSLDALMAKRGTLFERAIAPFPGTLSSHMSLFTGLYYRTHGVGYRDETFSTLATDHPTLPQLLGAAGYQTAAFTEDGMVLRPAGFERGFDMYTEIEAGSGPPGFIAETFSHGLAWLKEHADHPFFLFLHTYQVHWPYTPPPSYQAFFADSSPPADANEEARLRYEQEIRYADDHIRVLLDGLERLGVADQTLVIVLADHGEEFLEHGGTSHGTQLYDEVLRVPLVMRLPGVVPSASRVAVAVSLVDVLPTVLDLLGLPPPPPVDGVSLVPLLHDPPGRLERAAVYAEAPPFAETGIARLSAVMTATQTCLYRGPSSTYECYDTIADPREKRPLDLEPADRVHETLALLDDFRRTKASVAAAAATLPPDPGQQERLRALGYVQ